MVKNLKVRVALLATVFTLVNSSLFGQEKEPAKLQEKEVQPIRCWLRSDKSTVRIGEILTVPLTCQVAETEYEKVVSAENMLEPSSVSFSPYEVIRGWHHPDIMRDTFRFFQYQYEMRLIGEDFFGKEVPTPELEIRYKFERKIAANEVIDTRERSYIVPPLNIRVTALVPKDTKDIRDPSSDNFQVVKARQQNAYVAFVLAVVVFLFPFAVLLMPAFRSVKNWKKSRSNGTRFSNNALLTRMGRELNRVANLRNKEGWNSELVGRILTVVRIMGAVALSKQINQLSAQFESKGLEGQLKLRKGLIWPKKVLISSNLTPESIFSKRQEINREWTDKFLSVFTALNSIRYSQELDTKNLDSLLEQSKSLLKKVKFSNHWIVRKSFSIRVGFKNWKPVWRQS